MDSVSKDSVSSLDAKGRRSHEFDVSSELRKLFHEQFQRWQRRNFGGLDELARRCGVSNQYLAQVNRYGRIPGRPVLILLALNFDLSDPEEIFRAAGVRERWVLDDGVRLGKIARDEGGFLSLRFDVEGFTSAIRSVVKQELRPATLSDLIGGRPLRLGIHDAYHWLFDVPGNKKSPLPCGILSDLCTVLEASFGREISAEHIPLALHRKALREGSIDIYGPVLSIPKAETEVLYSAPLHSCGISGLFRKNVARGLTELDPPRCIEDIASRPYKIAVVRDSLPHLIASTKLRKGAVDLVLCDTQEEAVERLLLSSLKRPAHLFILDSPHAYGFAESYRADLELCLATSTSVVDMADVVFAVRADLAPVLPSLNSSIRFLVERGGFKDRMRQALCGIPPHLVGLGVEGG